MIELGELREGINREEVIKFYEKVFNLSHINVIGIGSNLGCMYGVEPTYDKLIQLCAYKELISSKFNKEIRIISGGSSITLPMLASKKIPKEVNHFRIGEAAFFGVSPLDNKQFLNLKTDTFELSANIIELDEKSVVPEGIINNSRIGESASYNQKDVDKKSYKAILDFGLLDVSKEDIKFIDNSIEFVGITSDMTVVDLGKNKNKDGSIRYKAGDKINFTPNYMAVARLLNSKFIEKIYV